MTELHWDYATLTPDTILDAIESVGVYASSGLIPLNSYENRVYQFVAEDGKRYVTKFYRPGRWSREQILEEHSFTCELAGHEIPVVAPLTLDDPRLGPTTLAEHAGYLFALFPSQGGRMFEVDNLAQIEQAGRFIGRIHRVASARSFTHRPTLSLEHFGHDSRQALAGSQLIPDSLLTPLFTVLDLLLQRLEGRLVLEPFPQLRLHGDCHPGNILWTNDTPCFVDLDDCRSGPAVQDLWMMLSGDRQQQLLQLDALIEGYEEFAEFDHRQLALIEPLRALRMIHYMAWLARRWNDPAFPLAFPWFASDKYWEGQILALKEQVAALDEPPLSLQLGF